MLKYEGLPNLLQKQGMHSWSRDIPQKLEEYFQQLKHGDVPKWQTALNNLPDIQTSNVLFNHDVITIGNEDERSVAQGEQLHASLQALMPWRKGPFDIFGIEVDAEWRSNLKWSRLADKVSLNQKKILDIGSGNGYYALRMIGAGAQMVIGVDPTLRFAYQFEAIKKYTANIPVYILPFTLEALPESETAFDTIFSMGVIYHRRDPADHLQRISRLLKLQGELVIESLVIDHEYGECLVPSDRYAKMNNVWWIPSVDTLIHTLHLQGFSDVAVLDISTTTNIEQRRTPWMRFESLDDFLDPGDDTRTIEGYPAPQRVMLHAIKRS